jgi:hypothetical protein
MVEIIGCIVRHAKFLHHPARCDIRWHGEGHQLPQTELWKLYLWKLYLWKLYRTTAFAPSVVRLAPMTRRQSPTNFHAGCEMCLE